MNEEKELEYQLATVETVGSNGLTLVFDGETDSDGKEYPCNASVPFAVGDRVKVEKNSGTYLVDFTIGAPGSKSPIPAGGASGQYLAKDGSTPYALKWADLSISGTLPTGGTAGQYLRKTGTPNYACEWAAISVSGTLPTGGTAGQYLRKTGSANYACEWAAVSVSGTLPTGGTAGQYLKKNSTTAYDASWTTPPVTGTTSTIGFMNTTATAKKSVSKLYTTATLATVITKVNDLLTALAGYGLLTSN